METVSQCEKIDALGTEGLRLERRLGPFLKEGEPWVCALHYRS